MLFHFLLQQCSTHLLHNRLLLSLDAKNPNATAMTPSDMDTGNIDLHTVSTVDNLKSITSSSGVRENSCKISKVKRITNSTSTNASNTNLKNDQKTQM